MTHKEIFEYWSGRMVFDLNSSSHCFACGARKALERAHIIAASIGGTATVDNLVLLCGRCHRDAPMLNDPSFMIEWIKNRESESAWKVRRVIEEIGGVKALHEFAAALEGRIGPNTINDAAKALGMDSHPSGDAVSSLAAVIKYLYRAALAEAIHCPS